MIYTDNPNIKIIGFLNSSMTNEFFFHISKENIESVEIITPDVFFQENKYDRRNSSYIVSFTLDSLQRQKTISYIQNQKISVATFVHHSNQLFFDLESYTDLQKYIGMGTFVGPGNNILLDTVIGKNCIIETGCTIGHYVEIGNNVIVHGNVTIGGRAIVGENCNLNMSCNIFPKTKLCSGVTIAAACNVNRDIEIPGFYAGYRAKKTVQISNEIS